MPMLESNSLFVTLIYILDVFGTAAFAVTGAFKATEHKYDIVGIIVLGTMTGTAGGIMRDLLFDVHPPNAISNPVYIAATVMTSILVFFLYRNLSSQKKLFVVFDAIGLGVFTLIGAHTAYTLFGTDLLLMAIGGLLTPIGEGIIRDVLVNEHPLVFTKEIYAAASFLGIVTFCIFILTHVNFEVAAIITILLVIVVRLLAVKYNWNLPTVRTS
jgi:uncharacterized membrane protein YeiH